LKLAVSLFVSAFAAATLSAQQISPSPAPDIRPLSDEFETAASLEKWNRFDRSEGWPDMVRRLAVADGHLSLEPYTSGWFAEFHAPFVFREVTGSFVATARVRVRGKESDVPAETWSLAGLMVREARPDSARKWEPRGENWLFLTTGVAFEKGKPVFETKTTVNSRSNLKLHPARSGWIELRIARVGPHFFLLTKYDGEKWRLLERFYRSDLPRTLQVGLNAYSGWDSASDLHNDPEKFNRTVLKDRRADVILDVDWIRFSRPEIPQGTDLGKLSDYSTPDSALLSFLGV
jgi:hypothetical protein